mmetsp:Transcript_100546/g.146769  ORF Transcript_100546/g.146769 Transcript_100546/m.146769 type:complete len:281 (+) Transcript_100546:120-962(+)
MPLRMSQLLELSHDLSDGRKRRYEWEALAERNCRPCNMSTMPTVEEKCEHIVEPITLQTDDDAETKYLGGALKHRGLPPRDPAVEQAMLKLLSASWGSSKRELAPAVQVSELDWMVYDSVATICPSARRRSSTSTVALTGKAKSNSAEDALENLISMDARDETVAPVLFEPPSQSLNAKGVNRVKRMTQNHQYHCDDNFSYVEDGAAIAVRRLPEALDRLRALCTPKAEDDYDMELEEELQMIEDMSNEAMAEAERQELSFMLLTTSLEVAVETHCSFGA